MTSATHAQSSKLQRKSIEIASQVFGEHPASVFAIIKNAAVAAENIDVIFGAFVAEMEKSGMCRTNLIRLAEIGRGIAINSSSYLSGCCNELSAALLAAGVDVQDARVLRLPSSSNNQTHGSVVEKS